MLFRSECFLILSSHLRLGLSKSLFPVGLPVKTLSTPTFLHSGYIPCPSQSSRFNRPDYIIRSVQTNKFFIVEPSPLLIFIPLARHNLLRILFLNTLRLRFSIRLICICSIKYIIKLLYYIGFRTITFLFLNRVTYYLL